MIIVVVVVVVVRCGSGVVVGHTFILYYQYIFFTTRSLYDSSMYTISKFENFTRQRFEL